MALMRGINVGGKNKLLMKDLVALFEEAGCREVRTYIQSGNVVFEGDSGLAERVRAEVPRAIADRFGYGSFKWIYALILLPSALWMPLTFGMIENPSSGLWLSIRLTLAAVGIGSLMLVAALLQLQPRSPNGAYRLAVVGSIAFTFQTAVLDALVWPAYFPA